MLAPENDIQEIEKRLAEREKLANLRTDLSVALVSGQTSHDILQRCAEAFVKHLDAAFARIWTLNHADAVLELQASAGLYTHIDGPHGRVKVGEYKIGRIAKNAQALMTNDVLHDPNISDPAWARKEGMIAFAGYPMLLEGRVFGVVAMFARHPFSEAVFSEFVPIVANIAQWVKRRQTESELAEQNRVLDQIVQQRTAKLQETIQELEAFSYSISHDMRSPLRAMQGYAEALIHDYREKLDPEAIHYLERIHRGATRLDLLIRDVLAYSKVARENVLMTPMHLETVIHDIVQNYPNLHSSVVEVVVAPKLPMVLAHEALLIQVFANLLGNAVKFARPDVFPRVTISAEVKGPLVEIMVEDNGIGISPEHLSHIFDIFGRIYPEKQYEGTGIGLAIVRKAAERMGGTVTVTSTLDTGSRFCINLPKAP